MSRLLQQLTSSRIAFVVGTFIFALALLFTDNYYLSSMFRSTSTATGQTKTSAIDDRQVNIHGGVRGFSPLQVQVVHVTFGLSGNHSGFLAEFEVALKSVLLNAPLELSLHIHILADEDAFASLKEIFITVQSFQRGRPATQQKSMLMMLLQIILRWKMK